MKQLFSEFPEVFTAMSLRQDGSMKIIDDDGTWRTNQENRRRFFDTLGINDQKIVSAGIAHGDHVQWVNNKVDGTAAEVDGLATDEKETYLTVTVADCIPVFLYEPLQKIIALSHAGWRGLMEGVLENTLRTIAAAGGDITRLRIGMGPSIQWCHFQIGADILPVFARYPHCIEERDGKFFVNLQQIIKEKLIANGVPEHHIQDDGQCTYCHPRFFSFRRDKPLVTKTMVAVMGLRE
jgi:YfiH family protein